MIEELQQLIQHLQASDPVLAAQVGQTRSTISASQGANDSDGIIKSTSAGLKVVLLRDSDVPASTYDALRQSIWSLEAWPGVGRWSDQHYVHIFTKDYAEIISGVAYHLTPVENVNSILSRGITIGRNTGSHTTDWQESKHYIHVSETDEQRLFWREKIQPGADRVEFRIRLGEARLRVYHDERSRGRGYVVDAVEIEPAYIDGPYSIPLIG